MSAPLPPYSTFRTDNKVRPTAAGPAGGIGSGRRPEKGRVPRTVRPSVLRGCTEDTSVRKVVRRRPSRAFSGPPTGGTRGRSFELNCHPFRSAVSNFQFPLFSLRHPSSFSLRHPPGPPNHRWSTFRPFPTPIGRTFNRVRSPGIAPEPPSMAAASVSGMVAPNSLPFTVQ